MVDEIWVDEYGKNFIRSDNAVSEVLGHIIILGISVGAVAIILMYSLPMIQDLKEEAIFKSVQQAFAVMDMRMSMVSEGSIKKTSFDIGGGTLTVMPNGTGRESYINIITNNNTFNVNIPMGKIRYSLGGSDSCLRRRRYLD